MIVTIITIIGQVRVGFQGGERGPAVHAAQHPTKVITAGSSSSVKRDLRVSSRVTTANYRNRCGHQDTIR
jgi:hypothetical protein